MRLIQALQGQFEYEAFNNVTEEEIISLWRCFRSGGLGWEEAWHAIVAGIALDMAFARRQNLKYVIQ